MPLTVTRQTGLLGILIVIITILVIISIIVLTRPKSKRHYYERKSQRGTILYHPYIVSLSELSSNKKKRTFSCNGVILSRNHVLVGGDCVEIESDWLDLQVRAGSIYWYKDGTTHAVEEFFQSNYGVLTILKIRPSIVFNDYISKVTLGDDSFGWKIAYTVDWYTNELEVYEKCLVQTWMNSKCESSDFIIGEIKDNASCKIKFHGLALVSKKSVLIGFQVGIAQLNHESTKHVFLDLQEGYYAQWIRHIIENNEQDIIVKASVKNVKICGFPDVYACYRSNHLKAVSVNSKTDIASDKFQTKRQDVVVNNRNKILLTDYSEDENLEVLLKSVAIAEIDSTTVTSTITPPSKLSIVLTSTTLTKPTTEMLTRTIATIPTTVTAETTITTTTAAPTTLLTVIDTTSLNIVLKPITQTTTEEPIWDNLPFEEAQFYNPV